jgi:hypothetical protein
VAAPATGTPATESRSVWRCEPCNAFHIGGLDLVHDAFGRQASNLNNDGLLAQIVYLVQELGPAETLAALAGHD